MNDTFLYGSSTPLLKVDAEIPLSLMCVGNGCEYEIIKAWTKFFEIIHKEGSVGSINELWETKNAAAFRIVEANRRLHHTTKKLSGSTLFAELGIKILDTQLGRLLDKSLMKAGDVKRIDFFLRGSVDITEYGIVQSIIFRS